ncbi:Set and mynd domain-containing protein 3 [Mycena sanguinolenta]|uniref:Set and mynd domain-containing protein 3 n=1 Tax=Mycena sanguinolenta TaxID=230812 RepID=A0A8H6X9J7_9AGAR|nr:Set and mynd domain-containing protein 3 [Mycena sanguinolenta]
MSSSANDSTTNADDFLFQHLKLSSKEIRSKRKDYTTSCSSCFTSNEDLGRPLRRCSKCQVASYCSTECQTRHWPEHKKTCGETDVPKLMPKLVRTLISNPILLLQLQSCFVLACNLLQHARCDEFLFARLDVAIEPASIVDFADIFLGKGTSKTTVPGMLQVNAFVSATEPEISSPQRRALWQDERTKADADGLHAHVVAVVGIVYADAQMALSVPLRIPPELMKLMPEWISRGLKMPSGIPGETITLPYSIENCLQCINAHIRVDTRNKMLLRTEMRPPEMKYIRDAGTNTRSGPAIILHDKIAREYIYASIYQTFLERRKKFTGVAPPNTRKVEAG